MRLPAILAATILAAAATGQVKLKTVSSGLPDGVASYSHKLLPDGSKFVQLSIEMRAANGRAIRVRSERTYSADGHPVRAFLESIAERPTSRRQATATFSGPSAHVVLDVGGKRSVSDVPLAAAAPRACLSEFWFLRDAPAPGAKVQYYHFDLATLAWVLEEAHYVGPAKVKVGSATYSGHHVRSKTGEAWLDARGLPIKLVSPGVSMERLPG